MNKMRKLFKSRRSIEQLTKLPKDERGRLIDEEARFEVVMHLLDRNARLKK